MDKTIINKYKRLYDTSSYITSYEENKENIIVHHLDKSIKVIPNTKENGNLILKKLREQVRDLLDLKQDTLDNKKIDSVLVLHSTFLLLLNSYIITNPSNMNYISFALSLIYSEILYLKNATDRSKYKKIKKIDYYIKNEELLNNDHDIIVNDEEGYFYQDLKGIPFDDLDIYTLDDLRNIVNLIKESDNNLTLKKI